MARADGRPANALRRVNIVPRYLKYAEGSCLIELGETKVICSASIEESVPPFLKNSGTGWVTAEYGMLPRSCQSRIPRGKDSGRTHEIQRLVGRSLRAVTEMKALGERTVWLDCDVMQGDGGTRTASITGAFVALCFALDTLRQKKMFSRIPLRDFVAATSVGVVQGEPALDLNYAEDSQAHVDMNVVMIGKGEFIEVQGTAERNTFSRETMNTLLGFAEKGIRELIEIQRGVLKGIL